MYMHQPSPAYNYTHVLAIHVYIHAMAECVQCIYHLDILLFSSYSTLRMYIMALKFAHLLSGSYTRLFVDCAEFGLHYVYVVLMLPKQLHHPIIIVYTCLLTQGVDLFRVRHAAVTGPDEG